MENKEQIKSEEVPAEALTESAYDKCVRENEGKAGYCTNPGGLFIAAT